jgi:hypothetical protein
MLLGAFTSFSLSPEEPRATEVSPQTGVKQSKARMTDGRIFIFKSGVLNEMFLLCWNFNCEMAEEDGGWRTFEAFDIRLQRVALRIHHSWPGQATESLSFGTFLVEGLNQV